MTGELSRVVYRGVSMIEGWPEKIREAQGVLTCTIDGQEVPRIRYGNESDDWGADRRPCHDCGVIKGELHVDGCDAECCPGCDGQRGNCDCEPYEDEDEG